MQGKACLAAVDGHFIVQMEANMRLQQAYDSHCNLVLGDVTETIYKLDDLEEEDEDAAPAEIKVRPCAVLLIRRK